MESSQLIELLKFLWKNEYTHWALFTLFPVLSLGIWVYRRFSYLYKNLKRPIFLFEMERGNLARVKEVLKETQLNPSSPTTDIKSLDSLTRKNSVCIVGYKGGSASDKILKDLIMRIRPLRIPLVVYTESRIFDSDLPIIQEYSYSEICNSPLRVVTLINSICQSFSYEEK